MRFAIPSKLFASSVFLTLALFSPFILPEKYPAQIDAPTPSKRRDLSIRAGVENQAPLLVNFNEPNHGIFTHAVAPRISPVFRRFIRLVSDGQADTVRGLFVTGTMALTVVQQPTNDWTFVSAELGNATQFQNASKNGVIGLLAHNYLSGRSFYRLKQGDQLGVVYGDGAVKYYQVAGMYRYQKIDPADMSSSLVDLSNGVVVSSGQVFERFYSGVDHLTLQTCLEKDGLSTWGLYFVVALPVNGRF